MSPSSLSFGEPTKCAEQLLARSREAFLQALRVAAGEVIHHPSVLATLGRAAGACFDELVGVSSGRMAGTRSIALVRADESDFAIALISLDRRLQASCGRDLAALHLRLRLLLREGGIELDEESPLGTACVCRALRALKDIEKLSTAEALQLLRQLELPLTRHLGDFYRQFGHALADRALTSGGPGGGKGDWTDTPAARASLPIDPVDALRQVVLAHWEAQSPSARRAAGLALLERVEASLADSQAVGGAVPPALDAGEFGSQLGPAQTAAVEVVETVCRHAESAPSLPPAIRTLLARLRLPLLRLALRSKTLLSLDRHPALRLFDRIADFGRTLAPDSTLDLPVCHELALLVHSLGQLPRPTRQDFETALGVVGTLLTKRRHAALERAAAHVDAAQRLERRELALHQASRAIYMLIGQEAAGVVPRFLAGYWVHVLAKAVYRYGPDSPQWSARLLTANRLLASALPPGGEEARRQLGAELPVLVQELKDGLAWIGLPAGKIAAALAPCMARHEALLAGRPEPAQVDSGAAAQPVLGMPADSPGLLTLKHKHYVAGELSLAPDWAALAPGDRVAVGLPDGRVLRGFVARMSPAGQVVLIADGDSDRVLAVTVRALAQQLAAPGTRLSRDESIVDEAAIERLIHP